tara:strand:- start:914 stop:1225 length:312 start_codon:yes stop_codon:yes gene_type:complete
MDLTDYEHICASTKNLDNLEPEQVKAYLLIGLAGEVGEVLNVLKKQMYYTNYQLNDEILKDELGDCLYYLTNLITDSGSSLEEIMNINTKKIKDILAHKLIGG